MSDPLHALAQIRIERALHVAKTEAMIDGVQHKVWVIDQMVRVLLGCPDIEEQFVGGDGETHTRAIKGESEAYLEFVTQCESWNIGEAP